ncbi:MAG: hypothetical protein RL346_698 [Verrucomicrobiota bacterium]|jgi:hypothetical protein
MKRQAYRFSVAISLVVLAVVLSRMTMGAYHPSPDPEARFEIEAVKVKQDRGFAWVEAHLKKSGQKDHDLKQRVFLVTADGKRHEPADTTFAGRPERGFSEIWFKFWLEMKELEGGLKLTLNGGTLMLKTSHAIPELGNRGERVFKSSNWEKSWTGF